MINEKFQKLCIKEITGNITEREKHLLQDWLAKSDENISEFEKLKDIWAIPGREELPDTIDINMEWTKLNKKLQLLDRDNSIESSFFKKLSSVQDFFIPKLKPILAGIFVLFISILGIYIFDKKVPEPQLNIITSSNNEYKNIELPDGSTVYLNSGSSIEYLSQSGDSKKIFNNGKRNVSLKGEAFFSVTRDNSPFIITTANAKITVLGTKFDVLARNENTRVVVKEGKVNFSQKINSKGINLLKDQLSCINKDSEPSKPKVVDPGYFLSWMHGNLVFYRTPLSEITSDLERRYNVNISLGDDSLKNYTLTGSFKNSNADSSLSMICLALGLDFEKQNNRYIIKEKDFAP
jgi:transmembrane sensor